MEKEFISLREKDSYAYERVKELQAQGFLKTEAVQKVKTELCDVSVTTVYTRIKREENRRKEVSDNGQ